VPTIGTEQTNLLGHLGHLGQLRHAPSPWASGRGPWAVLPGKQQPEGWPAGRAPRITLLDPRAAALTPLCLGCSHQPSAPRWPPKRGVGVSAGFGRSSSRQRDPAPAVPTGFTSNNRHTSEFWNGITIPPGSAGRYLMGAASALIKSGSVILSDMSVG